MKLRELMLGLTGSALALAAGSSANGDLIGFEAPAYEPGSPPPAPWVVSGTSLVSDSNPASGAQSLACQADSAALLPLSIPRSGISRISVKVLPGAYAPPPDGPNSFACAGAYVKNGAINEGSVLFAFERHGPPREAVPEDFTITIRGEPVGYFLPGRYHTVVFTWDWPGGMVHTRVIRPDGITYDLELAHWGYPLVSLELSGGTSSAGPAAFFDQIRINEPLCPADFNGDQQADVLDYADFAAALDTEDPNADFNLDAQFDFFDYLDFVAAFDQGCP